ncbi:MAG: type II toxin-antitoxin system RelE/ParE family toxin [Polyangiaceae bacterium]
MAELIIEPEAEAELEDAANRYEASVPGLGIDFLLEMRQRTLEVAEAPLLHPVFGGVRDVRCAHAIGRFPHLIVYMPFGDAVHILAFMHPRRRPGYWANRGPLRQ